MIHKGRKPSDLPDAFLQSMQVSSSTESTPEKIIIAGREVERRSRKNTDADLTQEASATEGQQEGAPSSKESSDGKDGSSGGEPSTTGSELSSTKEKNKAVVSTAEQKAKKPM